MSRQRAVSAYRITASTVDTMPVGGILTDKGVLLRRDWAVMNFETGVETWAVGVRIGRLCPTCRSQYKRATDLGHLGKCGPEVARFTPTDEVSSPPGQVTE